MIMVWLLLSFIGQGATTTGSGVRIEGVATEAGLGGHGLELWRGGAVTLTDVQIDSADVTGAWNDEGRLTLGNAAINAGG